MKGKDPIEEKAAKTADYINAVIYECSSEVMRQFVKETLLLALKEHGEQVRKEFVADIINNGVLIKKVGYKDRVEITLDKLFSLGEKES